MLFLMPKQQWQSTEGNLLSPVSKHMVMCEECRAWSISITHTSLTAPCPGLPGWAGTRKVKTSLDFTGAREVSGSGISWAICDCTSLQTDNHASTSPLSFLQAGCPSCRPTNSVKALKGEHLYQWTANSRQRNMTLDPVKMVQKWTVQTAEYSYQRLAQQTMSIDTSRKNSGGGCWILTQVGKQQQQLTL